MKFTFLGTGTSGGVPEIGCSCAVCRSGDPRDRRTRTAGLLELGGWKLLIDSGPDLRQQLLRHRVERIDGVLYTHGHADHIFGLDDLRALSFRNGRMAIPLHLTEDHAPVLKRAFHYLFEPPAQLGGGILPVEERRIRYGEPFDWHGVEVLPLKVMHGTLPVCAFRFGGVFAYITDASSIPPETEEALRGIPVLVLNALRPRPHSTHFHFDAAFETAKRLGAGRTWFVHMTHDCSHAAFEALSPAGTGPAHDGLTLSFP